MFRGRSRSLINSRPGNPSPDRIPSRSSIAAPEIAMLHETRDHSPAVKFVELRPANQLELDFLYGCVYQPSDS